MLKFVARRALMLVVALIVSSFAIFISLDLAPGNPLATLSGGRTLSPAAQRVLTHEYHLDQPVLTRYWHWVTGALHGNLGTSIAFREPVATLIGQRIGVTAELVLYAGILIVVFGVGLGLLAGLRRGPIDNSVIAISTILAAVPSFVAAIVLLALFSVKLGWLPSFGDGSGFGGTIEHLTLPAIALAASAFAVVVRVTRVTVRAELGQEHVQTATSRGIPWRLIVRRHVLRNASIPITTVVGITITSLFALAAVVEQAFNLNGIGAALVQAALSKDFAVVQGISLVLVAAFVLANAAVDLLYAVLDPRVASAPLVFPRARARMAANRLVWGICWAIVAIAVFLAIFGPLIRPHNPDYSQLQFQFVGPFKAKGYLLGFDSQGRDLLSRLMVGARTSMLGPVLVMLMSMGAGTVVAVVSAWRGGWVDSAIGTVLDIMFAFPAILLAVLTSAVFGAGLLAPTIALAIAYTPYIARVLRSAAVRERARDYIAAAEVQGLSTFAICFKHLIPNLGNLVVAQGTLVFAWAMVDLASISFLGLGVQPPTADWGVMVSTGETGVLQGYPLESLLAGLCIVLVVVAVNLLGERMVQRNDDAEGRR